VVAGQTALCMLVGVSPAVDDSAPWYKAASQSRPLYAGQGICITDIQTGRRSGTAPACAWRLTAAAAVMPGCVPAGAAQCNVCLPGSFSASAKSSSCNECPRGTFQNKYGQQECVPCKEGTYQDARASAKCKVCPAGTFNPEKGSVSAQACQ
jgi:hypothetical protein